jgi:hypothetical protein
MKRIYNKLSLLGVWPMKWRLARYAWPEKIYNKNCILYVKSGKMLYELFMEALGVRERI